MQRTCHQTGKPFEITDSDIEFLCKVGVLTEEEKVRALAGEEVAGLPTLCPEERSRRRMVWRNERVLYLRKCDKCGGDTFSVYHPESGVVQYCMPCYYSEGWEALESGQEFDFSRPFFPQMGELLGATPRRARVVNISNENSDYCNQAGGIKNCYLAVDADFSEQCLYCKGVVFSFDCIDCYKITNCEACYECLHCIKCSFSSYLSDSEGSNDCHFSRDLIGCHYCFGCLNLRNKEYHFFNKKMSKAEWEEAVAKIKSEKTPGEIFAQFQEFSTTYPRKFFHGNKVEDCSGDYLTECKSCHDCFLCHKAEENRHCSNLMAGDGINFGNIDVDFFGVGMSHCCESVTVGVNDNNVCFSVGCVSVSNLLYCVDCNNNCQDCFGCVSLNQKRYCILNKQYTKEQYEELLPRIIAHMKVTGEWGEFFPVEMCPFAYNETMAGQCRSLEKEEVLARGWKWREPSDVLPKVEKVIEDASLLPTAIADIPDDILNWAIKCEVSGRPFMIQKIELAFYRKMGLPVPHKHHDIRYAERIKLLNPYTLFHRKCEKCGVEFDTTYSPERPEIVYCEKCYQECVE